MTMLTPGLIFSSSLYLPYYPLFLFARVSQADFVLGMPPKAAVTEAAPIVYRDSLLGVSLQTAVRELIVNQGSLIQFPVCVRLSV